MTSYGASFFAFLIYNADSFTAYLEARVKEKIKLAKWSVLDLAPYWLKDSQWNYTGCQGVK